MNEKLKFNIEELKRDFDIAFDELCKQQSEMIEYIKYTESLEEEFSEMRIEKQELLNKIEELEEKIRELEEEAKLLH